MKTIEIHGQKFKPFLKDETIQTEIRRMAKEIKRDLAEKDPLFVCILNGAFMFASELMKELDGEYELTFAKYSSYSGMHSTGKLTEEIPPRSPLSGRTVVILEDLLDTGFTLSEIIRLYKERGAKEVLTAVMLNKPSVPKVAEVGIDYIGMEIPNEFIVGHGLDYDSRGRSYKDIYTVIE